MSTSTSSPPAAVAEASQVTDQPIDIAGLFANGRNELAGAVVLFSGEVRNHNLGRSVDYLEYESHVPMANKLMRAIVAEACQKWPLHHAVCVHRIGKLTIGQSAVVVVTASSHRAEAYEANQYIINRVKHEVPIWKKEIYLDGTHAWGNNANTDNSTQQQPPH